MSTWNKQQRWRHRVLMESRSWVLPKSAFANSLETFCNPQINMQVTWSHLQIYTVVKFLAKVKQGNVLLSCFSFILKPNDFSTVYLALCFSHLCAFYWWFRCLKWPPYTGLFSVPTCEKAVMCLMEKIYGLGTFSRAWVTLRFTDCESHVNESTRYFN